MTEASAAPPPASPWRLELAGIRKVYPTVVANDGVDLRVKPGEIHAVLGENGAGKSTLMKIIYGCVKPDAGEMRWEGTPVRIANPAHARAIGIGMVFQHFSLFETLTVVENVALALPGSPDLGELAERIETVSSVYGLPVEARRLVHSLSVGERQRVEIIRCLLQNPRLLIMDEPTSVLTPQAVRTLFETLRKLSAEGCSILYISHKLDEIQQLCHSATVLRGGKVTGHCDPRQETPKSMARMMIGKDLPHCLHPPADAGGESRLVIAGLSHASGDPFGVDLQDVHLTVHSGEIVGIAGVSGNGQQELLKAISGEERLAEKYPVQICGTEAGRMMPGQRRKLGMCFVPEERLGRGAVPEMFLSENGLLTAHRGGMVRAGMIRFRVMREFALRCIQQFNVKCGGPSAEAKSLSGGNLQKYIVGREILQNPKVLVVAQP
jgi:simple sugar transport system ATP-binding protein